MVQMSLVVFRQWDYPGDCVWVAYGLLCEPHIWPGHYTAGVINSKSARGMSGLHTLIKPLMIKYIQLSGCNVAIKYTLCYVFFCKQQWIECMCVPSQTGQLYIYMFHVLPTLMNNILLLFLWDEIIVTTNGNEITWKDINWPLPYTSAIDIQLCNIIGIIQGTQVNIMTPNTGL